MALPRPVLRIPQPASGVGVTFQAVPIEGRGTYDVDLDIAEVTGMFECVGIAVRSTGARRVDGGVLRSLRVADFTRAAASWLEESALGEMIAQGIEGDGRPGGLLDEPLEYLSPEDRARREWYDREVTQPAKAQAQRYRRMVREASRAGGFTRLAAAAAIYKRATRAGRHPTKAVADELDITHNAAVGLVRRCRAEGLLPPTSKGIVSASAPPKRKRTTDGS